MIVIDASALVEVLLRTPKGTRVAGALGGQDTGAPELLDVEVLSATARLVRNGALTDVDAARMVAALRQMPVTRVSHAALAVRAWQLRDRVRIADAFYVACGEFFGCPLLTCDARLARAALPGTSVLLIK
ncbi:MAG: type II toxin-antitoxin system VapC family toxin [Micromonosporaceae bacterium]